MEKDAGPAFVAVCSLCGTPFPGQGEREGRGTFIAFGMSHWKHCAGLNALDRVMTRISYWDWS